MTEVDRLLAWRRGDRPGPQRLHLVLTERCNLRCLSCHGGAVTPPRDEVPDERLLSAVHQAIELGTEEIYLVGGEVFVRRALTLRLMGAIKRAGLRGDLTTNGTGLDAATVRRIVAMGWDRLQVSLDGANAATNDALRPPAGTHDAVIAGLRRIQRRKRRVDSDLPRVALTTVLTRHNVNQMSALVDLAADHGADEITFQSLKDMSPHCTEMHVPAADLPALDAAAGEAQRRAAARGLLTNAGNFRQATVVDSIGRLDRVMRRDVHDLGDPVLGSHCFVPWTTLVVHVNGRVSPCWEWDGPELGNLREQELAAIWHGAVFRSWRETFAARRVPAHCAQCCLGFVDHTRWIRLTGLLQDGQYREALALADGLLAEDPRHRDATDAKAAALFALGRADEAEAWIREQVGRAAEGLGRSPAFLLAPLGDAGRHGAVLELAEELLEDEVPRRGAARAALQARIRALYALDRSDEARGVLRRATDATEGDVDAAAELLFEAHRARGRGVVIELATTLLERSPDQPFALWIRGAARGKLGETAAALTDVTAALEAPSLRLTGFEDAIHDTLAELHLQAGDPERARDHALRALALCPGKPESLTTLAKAKARLTP